MGDVKGAIHTTCKHSSCAREAKVVFCHARSISKVIPATGWVAGARRVSLRGVKVAADTTNV